METDQLGGLEMVVSVEKVRSGWDLGHFEGRADRICRWTGCERNHKQLTLGSGTERPQEAFIEI